MKQLLIPLSLIISTYFFTAATPAQAQSPIFEDTFQTLDNWEPTRDDGSYWKVENEQALATVDRGSKFTELVIKQSVLPSYPPDQIISFTLSPQKGIDRNVTFQYQNNSTWAGIHFLDRYFNVVRVVSGKTIFNEYADYPLPNGSQYSIVIALHYPTIQIYINNKLIFTQQDWTASILTWNGRVGIAVATGSVYPSIVGFDSVKILPWSEENLASSTNQPTTSEPHLIKTVLKQTDPLWKNSEYDHAKKWSTQPTIARWGCALTSMVMVLQYHAITQLPDNTPLTPQTLNTWLLSQPDGYIGEGMLNWLAVTRLTWHIAQKFNTPKLEFLPISTNIISAASSHITNGNPVILQLPNHFVVGDGVLNLPTDLAIADPFYSKTKLSEHNSQVLSGRSFTPSHTNLSYIQIIHTHEQKVRLLRNQKPVETYKLKESLFGEDEKTVQVVQTLLPKPEPGEYTVVVEDSSLLPTPQIKLNLYTPSGEVTSYTVSPIISPPYSFTLTDLFQLSQENEYAKIIELRQFGEIPLLSDFIARIDALSYIP